jgi:hypothetical protein
MSRSTSGASKLRLTRANISITDAFELLTRGVSQVNRSASFLRPFPCPSINFMIAFNSSSEASPISLRKRMV